MVDEGKTPSEVLCAHLPAVFANFLDYRSQLEFEEQPDYDRWRSEFAAVAEETYDWEVPEEIPGHSVEGSPAACDPGARLPSTSSADVISPSPNFTKLASSLFGPKAKSV